jgi:hypothetical protein
VKIKLSKYDDTPISLEEFEEDPLEFFNRLNMQLSVNNSAPVNVRIIDPYEWDEDWEDEEWEYEEWDEEDFDDYDYD